MIPKYFRCGDPTGKCPLAVTRDIVKKDPTWKCPCSNPVCEDSQEPVDLVNGLSKGRARLVYGVLALLVVIFIALKMTLVGDPAAKRLDEMRAQLTSLESEVAKLETNTGPTKTPESPASRASTLERTADELMEKASAALGEQNPATVDASLKQIRVHLGSVRIFAGSADAPGQGTGVRSAEASRLVAKLQGLEEEGDTIREEKTADNSSLVPAIEDFIDTVKSTTGRARRLVAVQSGASAALTPAQKEAMASLVSQLEDMEQQLAAFTPPARLPFLLGEADYRMAASSDLATSLVSQLVAKWAGGEPIPGPKGSYFLRSARQGKVVVETYTAEDGFAKLASGEIATFISDRAPTSAELQRLGANLTESRSVAEVIALDALTLLVHPDASMDSFTLTDGSAKSFSAGPEDSPVHRRATLAGLNASASANLGGEQAALTDKGTIALGLYHTEGTNLRAKRLAVRSSSKAMALKPSPFTIATEDYSLGFRIVAWTGRNPKPQALAFVKFATSNEGQAVVANQGFVDLRLRPMQGDVPPEIMAALAAALGVDRIQSAMRISTNLRFATNKSELDLKAQADIERLPRFVADNHPTEKVVILGFTDSTGPDARHKPLSKERAEAVAVELRKSKVDTRSGGMGQTFPVDSNDTESGKARNRRSEVWIVKP